MQRENKDRLCVVKGGGGLGGYGVGRNKREREGRWCVCMLCVRLSFISLSFVFTPFYFPGMKWKAMRSPRHPNVAKASKSEVGDTVHVYNVQWDKFRDASV